MSAAARKDHIIEKGATFSYQFQVQNGADGSAFNLTGYTGQAEVRDGSKRLVCAMTVTIATPTNGTIVLSIPAATTVNLREGIYDWDCFIRATSPETRLLYGKAEVIPSISARP
jgi:anionic cell wall polymer biosynthesis LytR-Cps2A-Psr (LCP) family protein